MKYYFFLIIFSLSFVSVLAQDDYDKELPPSKNEEFIGFGKKEKFKKNKPIKDLSRIRIGGSVGLGFYDGLFNIGLSPLVGYQVVEDRLELGGGFTYDYLRYKNNLYIYNQHTIGPVAYIRGYIWKGLFAQVRGVYQKSYANQLNRQTKIKLKAEDDLGNVYAAVGYSLPMGSKVFFNIGLEVNLIAYDLSRVNASAKRVFTPFMNIQFSL